MSWLDASLDDIPNLGQAGPSRPRTTAAKPKPKPNATFLDRLNNAPDDDDPMGLDNVSIPQPKAKLAFEKEEPRDTPLQQMIRAWLNERHAPDILQIQDAALSRLLDHIRSQTSTIQLLSADPQSSSDEHFRIMLAQTEIERVKFIVRSYVRTRLYKIEKYARYIVSKEEVQSKLSASELDHATRFARLQESHFKKSVLSFLPEEQRELDDEAAFMPPMIPAPDRTKPVFAQALMDCPPVRLPDGTALEMEKGRVSLTPYHVVEQLLERSEVELV